MIRWTVMFTQPRYAFGHYLVEQLKRYVIQLKKKISLDEMGKIGENIQLNSIFIFLTGQWSIETLTIIKLACIQCL